MRLLPIRAGELGAGTERAFLNSEAIAYLTCQHPAATRPSSTTSSSSVPGVQAWTFETVNVVVRRSHGAITTALEPIPTMPGEPERLFADPTWDRLRAGS